VKLFQQGYPHHDKQEPKNQGTENAPKEYFMLVDGIDTEVGENQQEYKDIIDAEGFFNQVSREVIEGWLRSHKVVDTNPKNNGLCNPDPGPDKALFDTDFVRFPIEDFQINNQHRQDKGVK
jgi:hypothetical protein